MTPANRPEDEAAPQLQKDMSLMGMEPDVLLIDRAYLKQPGGAGSGAGRGSGVQALEGKLNVRDGTITCPAGQVEPSAAPLPGSS